MARRLTSSVVSRHPLDDLKNRIRVGQVPVRKHVVIRKLNERNHHLLEPAATAFATIAANSPSIAS